MKLEKELKTLTKQREDFNKELEKKVKETGLDIRLFAPLVKGWFKETFDIFDEDGRQYGLTSTGNSLYIEFLIAKMFVKHLNLDFILFDKFESIWNSLREKIIKEAEGLQIIATQVTKDKKIKIKKWLLD